MGGWVGGGGFAPLRLCASGARHMYECEVIFVIQHRAQEVNETRLCRSRKPNVSMWCILNMLPPPDTLVCCFPSRASLWVFGVLSFFLCVFEDRSPLVL